ncbi:MAG: RNA methyltransferase [Acidimicrobiia bacterium]|nr:RNA methyltransferase [Acidimicrobiia bacterium]MDH4363658.1 RNA methyltransferase [Acidimicrobiia bacterium]MDH5291639.1 RNA methyltransferase [Acidimicrobiia bacterium]
MAPGSDLGSLGSQLGRGTVIPVIDPDDPRIQIFQGLRDHVLRQRRERTGGDMGGVFVSEGDLVVERALLAGYRLHAILVDGRRTRALPDAVGPDVPVYAAGPEVLQRITGYHLHRGMLACFHRRPVPTAADVLAGPADGYPPLTLALAEGVNNPTNMGVILRAAAGLGVEAFLLDPTCCDPLYRRSARVSMGEAFALPYARLDHLPDGLGPLRDAGVTVLALTPAPAAENIGDLELGADERVALVLGAEGPGLTPATLAAADRRLRIPMAGRVDSVNVGSAAAIAFYAVRQARRPRS